MELSYINKLLNKTKITKDDLHNWISDHVMLVSGIDQFQDLPSCGRHHGEENSFKISHFGANDLGQSCFYVDKKESSIAKEKNRCNNDKITRAQTTKSPGSTKTVGKFFSFRVKTSTSRGVSPAKKTNARAYKHFLMKKNEELSLNKKYSETN